MIKTRDLATDSRSCGRCIHLRYNTDASCYCCGVDGQQMPDPELMTLTVCGCYKEVKKPWQKK